jgi:hypothetical protein
MRCLLGALACCLAVSCAPVRVPRSELPAAAGDDLVAACAKDDDCMAVQRSTQSQPAQTCFVAINKAQAEAYADSRGKLEWKEECGAEGPVRCQRARCELLR